MLYHRDTGIPRKVLDSIPWGLVPVEYSQHARERLRDKYGMLPCVLPRVVGITPQGVVEVETRGNVVAKVLVRVSFGDYDLCMPLVVGRGPWYAKTLWLNHKEDNHHTLNRAAYARC